MRPRRSPSWVLVLVGLLCLTGCSDDATPQSRQFVAGIEVIEVPVTSALPADPQPLANAYQAARNAVRAYPERLSYAYKQDGGIVVSAIAPLTGRPALRLEAVRSRNPEVTFTVRYVEHSRALLETIRHDLIGPQPEGMIVRQSGTDPERNQVVLSVDELNEDFARRVARTYPASAVAFTIDDSGPSGY